VRVLILLLSFTCASVLADESDDANNDSQNPDCETHTVRSHATNATNTITRCRGEAIANLPHQKPITKDTEKNSKENPNLHWELINNFDDLSAQESMAHSTSSLVSLTTGGLIVSFLGLGLLGWTLRETRRTADAADRTANAAENADKSYLIWDMSASFVQGETGGVDRNRVIVRAKVQNYGRTPATNFSCAVAALSRQDFKLGGNAEKSNFNLRSFNEVDVVEAATPIGVRVPTRAGHRENMTFSAIGVDVETNSEQIVLDEFDSMSLFRGGPFLICAAWSYRDVFGIENTNDSAVYTCRMMQVDPTERDESAIGAALAGTNHALSKTLTDELRIELLSDRKITELVERERQGRENEKNNPNAHSGVPPS